MDWRIETKYLCTEAELAVLQSRLPLLMQPDRHQQGEAYLIRSLYFDTWDNAGLQDNEAGVDEREKYRIRFYNNDPAFLRLEIKQKRRGCCRKLSCPLSPEQLEAFRTGTLPSLPPDAPPALSRFWLAAAQGLRPAAIIQYERSAFVYPAGNVRVTFDRHIAAARPEEALFDPQLPLRPVLPTGFHLLEVKYDEFLPEPIARLLDTGRLRQSSFSKYYLGRQALDL